MPACPACKALLPAGSATCSTCGASLAAEAGVSMSDTVSAATMAAAAAAPTPAPVVRSNPTPGSMTDPDAPAAPRSDSIVGARLAERYQVTRKIGEGGMGAVYEARHLLIGKRVAVKVLLEKYVEKPDVVARLQQEARLASSIGHEHIIDITDFGQTDDGRTFFVMEFLEGESLAHLLADQGPLPPARAVAIARQVAGALGAAHGKGVVHRDIKPENVFITRRGDRDFVKVVDFGISKAMRPLDDEEAPGGSSSPRLTQTGMVLGTPLYMSPEQARGEEVLDHRIDVYALGVILYETITGEVPFRGANYLSIISQVLSQDPRPPSTLRPDLEITPALEAVVMKAMAKDRSLRYQTMAELDADLKSLETGDDVSAMSGLRLSVGTHGGIRQGGRARLLVWAAAVLVVVAAAALLVWRLVPGSEPAAPPPVIVQAAPTPAPAALPVDSGEKPVDMIRVTVRSKPSGAAVWWGGLHKGVTPITIELPRGKEYLSLTLRLDGHEETSAPFNPTKDQELLVTLPKIKAKRPPRAPRPQSPPGANDFESPRDQVGKETKSNPFEKK